MRVLAVTPTPVWPVRDGIALRIHHLLTALASSASIELIADASQDSPPPGVVAAYRPVALQGRWRSIPAQYTTAPLVASMNAAIAEHRPDAVLLWPGAEFLAWTAPIPSTTPVVADRIDCLTLTYWRAARRRSPTSNGVSHSTRSYLSAMRDVAEVAFYERRVVRSVEAVIAVGDDDARVLRRLGGPGAGSRVHVVTNGVDAAPHQHDSMQRDTPGIAGTTDAPIVVFTGTLNYEPNMRAAVLLARTIWPRVLADIPTARLIIAGRNPSEDVEALGGLPGVMIRANVRDMNDVLASAWLAAAPMLSGSGVKNKVLEAWAAGLPVVMSPLAVNGLVLPTGHDALVSPDPLRLAAIIVTLLRSSARRQELGRAAVDLVRSRYTWEAAAERLLRLMTTAPIRQRDPHPHH